MDLEKVFQQLKNIEPNASYTRDSRARIVGGPRWYALPRRHPLRILLQGLQSGSAIALTGLTLVLILGGFSIWRVLNLVGLSGLDPAGLRAEAQAVDLQIQLSNLEYADVAKPQAESTAVSAVPRPVAHSLTAPKKDDKGAAATSSLDIDGALDILSQ